MVVLLSGGCYGRGRSGPAQAGGGIVGAEFLANRVELHLSTIVEVKEIEVQDLSGARLLVESLPAVPAKKVGANLPWEKGTTYIFRLETSQGQFRAEFAAPSEEIPLADFSVQIPAGTGGATISEPTVLPGGSLFSLGMVLSNFSLEPVETRLVVEVPKGFEVPLQKGWKEEFLSHGPSSEGVFFQKSVTLQALENRYEDVALRAPERTPEGARIRIEANFATVSQRLEARKEIPIEVLPLEKLRGWVRVRALEMPTDFLGNFDVTHQADTVSLPSLPGRLLSRFFSAGPVRQNLSVPCAYQTVRVENISTRAIPLVVSADILEENSEAPARGFEPPERFSVGERLNVEALVLKGRSVSNVVLPIYVYPAELMRGVYRRVITGRIYGTEVEAFRVEKPLVVLRENRLAQAVFGFALLVSFGGLGTFLFLLHRWLASGAISVRNLVMIALFGSTSFVVVSLPATILFNIVRVLTGPFSFLVAGFFSVIVLYALLAALIVLIPRTGTVFLATVVQFLLDSVFFGEFSPVGFLFTGTMVVFIEIALLATGVTSGVNLLRVWERHPTIVSILVASALGLANAASLWVNFHLAIVLYRLYYAHWYVLLTVAVTGFLYTFVGAWWGLRLGNSLKKFAG